MRRLLLGIFLLLLGVTVEAQLWGPATRVALNPPVVFADLPAAANGVMMYCSDCTSASPTAGGGTGAIVKREGGAWNGGGGGGIAGSLGATDNAVLRADGTGGATAQGSALIIGDVAGASLPVSTTAGNALAVSATAPAATTGASQTGKNITVTASAAVASTDTAGAAAGGSITLTAGNAARLTSGNANGGNITLAAGAGIGTGTPGQLIVPNGDNAATPGVAFAAETNTGFARDGTIGGLDIWAGGALLANFNPTSVKFLSTAIVGWSLSNITQNLDVGLSRDAAGGLQINGGTAGTTKGYLAIVADANGSKVKNDSASELLTLSTGGTTTNTAGNLGVANSDIEAILARVTTTITTATNWSVAVTTGITSCTNAWVAIGTTTTAQTGLTAGTEVIFKPAAGLQCHVGTASTLTVTTTGTPGAGAIRLTPIVKTYTAPTS